MHAVFMPASCALSNSVGTFTALAKNSHGEDFSHMIGRSLVSTPCLSGYMPVIIDTWQG